MRKAILILTCWGITSITQAQVVTQVLAPTGLAGAQPFVMPVDWALVPSLYNPLNAVTDTAVFVDDGGAADSLGCGSLINASEVSGRIAVIYRGDCEFGTKAMRAQDAGALAVVVINNVPGVLPPMGVGLAGDSVLIPIAIISDSSGMLLHDAIAAGDVVLYLGPPCVLDGSCTNAMAHVASTPHKPGLYAIYWVSATNFSTAAYSNAAIDLNYDPLLQFQSATLVPTVNDPGHLQWNMPTIPGPGAVQIEVTFDLPFDPLLIGDAISATVQLNATDVNADPVSATYTLNDTIVSSYDPNDKRAFTSSGMSGQSYFLAYDDYVDYTVRFQNTGNATAEDVFIVDTISDLYQQTTPEVLGASHAYDVSWTGDHILRFDFHGIQLPDSTSDLAASQGHISFRLRPVSDIAAGSTLSNFADIHFDNNPPVRTNTSELLVADGPFGVEESIDGGLRAFPNPTDGRLILVRSDASWNGSLTVRSLTGAEILTVEWPPGSSSLLLDLSDLVPGLYMVECTNGTDRTSFRIGRQ